jgi:hypothetical protein
VIFASLPLLVAMLTLPAGSGNPAPQGDLAAPGEPVPQEEAGPGTEGVLIRAVLMDLAALLDPEAPAPASPAAAVARLQAAGMAVPADLDPDLRLRRSDAVRLAAAVGLKMTARPPVDTVLSSGLENTLVRLLHTALTPTREPGE